MRYVGMDIHSKTTTFCVIDDEGKVCKRGKVNSGEAQWLEVVGPWPCEEVSVALETGNMTWWVVDVLRGAGIEPVVVDARQMKLISHSKKKTDKHDARALADAMRGGLAQRYSVHVPREIARRGRSLLGTRHLIVKQSVAQWHAARGMLRSVGVLMTKNDWKKAEGWERILGHPPVPIWMKPLLITHHQIWEQLESERKSLDAMVRTELSQWPEAEIVMEMPGFGPLVSLAVLSHLDDPHRFKRSCQVASYSGLVPSSRNSAEVVRQGGITHQGSAILRHLMVQAGWSAIRSKQLTPGLRKWFGRLLFKAGPQKAVVALARRLLVLAHRLLKNGEAYNPMYPGVEMPAA